MHNFIKERELQLKSTVSDVATKGNNILYVGVIY